MSPRIWSENLHVWSCHMLRQRKHGMKLFWGKDQNFGFRHIKFDIAHRYLGGNAH